MSSSHDGPPDPSYVALLRGGPALGSRLDVSDIVVSALGRCGPVTPGKIRRTLMEQVKAQGHLYKRAYSHLALWPGFETNQWKIERGFR